MKKDFLKSGFGIGSLIFAVAAIIALPLRTIQFFTVLEDGTGFYSQMNFGVYLLFAVIGAAIASLLILGISKRKKLSFSADGFKSQGCGILSYVAAAGAVIDAVNSLNLAAGLDLNLGLSTAAFDEITPVQSAILGLEGIFGIVSAIFFVVTGAALCTGKSTEKSCRYLALAPVFWSILRMVFRFTRTISYIRVSDLLFEMIMLIFFIAFFFAFAQVNSKINAKYMEWKVASYGLCAAVTALICFVPRFIVIISGNTEHLYSMSTAEYCDIAVALFALGTVFTRIGEKTPEEIAADAANDAAKKSSKK